MNIDSMCVVSRWWMDCVGWWDAASEACSTQYFGIHMKKRLANVLLLEEQHWLANNFGDFVIERINNLKCLHVCNKLNEIRMRKNSSREPIPNFANIEQM